MANENKKGGFEFGVGGREGKGGGRGGPGGPGGRDGGRGGGRGDKRGGGRGKDRDDRGGGAYRIATELPALEKALTTSDFARQKSILEGILKGVRPLRLKSLEGLEMGTRGKLLTTLLRVQRQPRPAALQAAEAGPAGAPADTGSAGEAAPEGTSADTAPEAEAVAASPDAQPEGTAPEEASAVATEAPAAEATEAQAADESGQGSPESASATAGEAGGEPPAADPEQEKARGYQEVLFLIGRIWRAVGEGERAQAAFALSGRPAPDKEEPVEPEPTAQARPEGGERGPRRERGERPARGDRPPRGDRPERPARPERPPREDRHAKKETVDLPVGGNWQEVAKEYEDKGRTRDAARVHEKNASWVEATRLFSASGSPREALRCAVASHDDALIRQVLTDVKVEDARPVLEKAQAWELLMEKCVAAGDFETVAKLYERARQFDQAGLAWERAGKLSLARKAFERARDFKSVQRLRNLEVDKLIERGDRMGAAQMLVQSRRKEEAVAVLLSLAAPKAYRFLERLKLDDAARALAHRELEKATGEGKAANRARWLELLDESAKAAEAWAEAGRLEKASTCNERAGNLAKAAEQAEAVGELDRAQDLFRRAGDTANMERVAALPRPSPEERKKHRPTAEQEAEDREHDDARVEAAASTEAAPEAVPEAAPEAQAQPTPGAPEPSGPPGEPASAPEGQ